MTVLDLSCRFTELISAAVAMFASVQYALKALSVMRVASLLTLSKRSERRAPSSGPLR